MVSASAARLPNAPVVVFDLLPAPGASVYAQRAKIALLEKGIPHKVELIERESKPKEFLDLVLSITSNPAKATVPTIIDGDVKLTESAVVVEYLDTAYPDAGPKLFPKDAKLLAKAQLFVELFTAEVQPNGFKVLKAESQEEVDAGREALTHGLKVLDGFLKNHGLEGGDFLLGKDFSYAEVATLPFVHRFNLTLPHYHNVDPLKIAADNGWHRVEKWIKAGIARPSIRQTTLDDSSLIKRWGKFVKPFNK